MGSKRDPRYQGGRGDQDDRRLIGFGEAGLPVGLEVAATPAIGLARVEVGLRRFGGGHLRQRGVRGRADHQKRKGDQHKPTSRSLVRIEDGVFESESHMRRAVGVDRSQNNVRKF